MQNQKSITSDSAAQLVDALLKSDPAEGERVAAALFGVSTDLAGRDEILERVLAREYWVDRSRAPDRLEGFLRLGAFRLNSSGQILEWLRRSGHVDRMKILGRRMLQQFPGDRASERDALVLLDCVRTLILDDKGLAEEGLQRVQEFVDHGRLTTEISASYSHGAYVETKTTRATVAFQVVALLAGCCRAKYRAYVESYPSWKAAVDGLDEFEAVRVSTPVSMHFARREVVRWHSEDEAAMVLKVKTALSQLSVARARTLLEAQPPDIQVPLMLGVAERIGADGGDGLSLLRDAAKKVDRMADGINRLQTLYDMAALFCVASRCNEAAGVIRLSAESARRYCHQDNIGVEGERECIRIYNFLASRAPGTDHPDGLQIRDSSDPSLRSRILTLKLGQAAGNGK
jgi:hypothetical protein